MLMEDNKNDLDTIGDIYNQPYLLQIDINHAKHIPRADLASSDPYAIIRFGNNEVARTNVVKWTLNPVWNESFTIPLLHIQHIIFIELWDWNLFEDHEIIGKVALNLNDLSDNTYVEDDFPLEQAGRIKASGFLSMGIFLEKRKNMIKITHSPVEICHSHVIESIHSTAMSKRLRQGYNELKVAPCVQEAIEKSDFLKQNCFDYLLYMDIVHDMMSLSHAEHIDSSDVEVDVDKAAHPEASPLPMRMHRIDDHRVNPAGVPVSFSTSTRINLSTGNVDRFICPHSKFGRYVFVVEADCGAVVLVAPSKLLMWFWIRALRRSLLAHKLRLKEGDVSGRVSGGDLQRKFHVCGPEHAADCEESSVVSGVLRVVIQGQPQNCFCRLDVLTLVLSCEIEDGDVDDPGAVFPLASMTSICVSLDYAECDDLRLRFDLMSAKLVLSRASKQSSYNDKSTFEQIKHGMTVVSSLATRVVVNFMDGRDLTTNPIEGISPFWNMSCTIGVNRSTFWDDGAGPQTDRSAPAAMHMHMLTGPNGHETVLGSKVILYSDLYAQDTVNSLFCQYSEDVESFQQETKLQSHVVALDMNIGLHVEIISGEGLVQPEPRAGSSFVNLFGDKTSLSSGPDSLLFDPVVDVRCLRLGDSSYHQCGYRKYK